MRHCSFIMQVSSKVPQVPFECHLSALLSITQSVLSPTWCGQRPCNLGLRWSMWRPACGSHPEDARRRSSAPPLRERLQGHADRGGYSHLQLKISFFFFLVIIPTKSTAQQQPFPRYLHCPAWSSHRAASCKCPSHFLLLQFSFVSWLFLGVIAQPILRDWPRIKRS